jgi:ketosteroid isomerase-like protein
MTTTATPPQFSAAALLSAIDAMDVDGFVAHLAEDVRFRFGNGAPVIGRRAVRNAVGDFFTTIRGLRHELLDQCADGDRRVLETDVTYTRLDGADVTLPVVSVLHLGGNLVTDYRVYVDLAPVYA